MLKIFNFLLFSALSATFAMAQTRVHWIHGLNDNRTFWATQEVNFPGRTLSRQTYTTNAGVNQMAQEIEGNTLANARGIFIGHSMGGLAIRLLDEQQPNHFGGAVVFGAPLDGSLISTNLSNGEANRVLTNADNILQKGPDMADDLGWFTQLADYLFSPFSLKGARRAFIRYVSADVMASSVGGAIDDFGEVGTSLSADDLEVGSPFIQDAQGFASNKPKVVVWGNENEGDVHVRLASSSLSDGVNDTEFFENYNEAKSAYNSAANSFEPNGICLLECNKKRNISNAFRDGYHYLNSGFERDWEILTGAYRIVTSTYTEWVNLCAEDCDDGTINCNPDLAKTEGSSGFSRFTDCWVQQTFLRETIIRQPYDGLLTRSTQIGENSAWTNNNTAIVEAEGVNHEEMGENEQSRIILESIFNGDPNEFFEGN